MRHIYSAQRGHHERKSCSGKKAAGVMLTRGLIASDMQLLPLIWHLLKCRITVRPQREAQYYGELAFKLDINPGILNLSNRSTGKVIV
ncbi:hypothetical protein XELAEV_18029737mg [Xenopus laevis]|uniref:Uncharacterized protein n=1 Tax=Xenopus laevis TaxID=8355 RepID=A0A974CU19_XENLA|nr:hypothetical protein XELAEV_18029737mg [Xenopus laevis]